MIYSNASCTFRFSLARLASLMLQEVMFLEEFDRKVGLHRGWKAGMDFLLYIFLQISARTSRLT